MYTNSKKAEGNMSDSERAESSKLLRDRGNKCYAKRDFAGALSEYGKSVLAAPLDDKGRGREAALGLGNRSAVFYERGEHDKCLDDAEAAFRYGYPAELAYKLHERAAKSLVAVNRSNEAKEAYAKALEAADKSNMKDKKREDFKKEVKEAVKNLPKGTSGKTVKKSVKLSDRPCPFNVWDRHPNFPPLSDSLEVVFNDTVGRHVIATKSIRAGEALVIEDAIASHLSPYKLAHNCCHCLGVAGDSVLPSPLLPRRGHVLLPPHRVRRRPHRHLLRRR